MAYPRDSQGVPLDYGGPNGRPQGASVTPHRYGEEKMATPTLLDPKPDPTPSYRDLKLWLWQASEYEWARLMVCIRQPQKRHRMLIITNESVFPLSQHVFERKVKPSRTELGVSDRWKQYLWLQYTEKGPEAVRDALKTLWEGPSELSLLCDRLRSRVRSDLEILP